MNAPRPEHEVATAPLTKELRDLGCPYPAHDDRAMVWLDGARAGLAMGKSIASRTIAETLSRSEDHGG